jgi:RNA polymerase sigma factor (sigma-70 family)
MLARVVKPEGVKRIISEKLHRNGRLELQGSGHFSYLAKDETPTKQQRRKAVPPVNVTLQNPSCQLFDVDARDYDDGLSAFAHVRPRLFGIAYRMLGSAADAEDIVQNAWLSWQCTNRSAVENPSAFLTTTTTRLCINLSQSARSRRETSSETRHLEPVDISGDPGVYAEREQALKVAMLRLKTLLPAERAAYILRVAFDYSYRQIADILKIKEANSRQLVSRARKRINEGRHIQVSLGEPQRLLHAFMAAAHMGDLASLEDLLVEEVISSSGAGIVRSDSGYSSRFRRKRRLARSQGCRYPRPVFATASVRDLHF